MLIRHSRLTAAQLSRFVFDIFLIFLARHDGKSRSLSISLLSFTQLTNRDLSSRVLRRILFLVVHFYLSFLLFFFLAPEQQFYQKFRSLASFTKTENEKIH